MSQETLDIIQGAVLLVIFLIFVFALGTLLTAFKNARFAKAWAPLVAIINGTIVNDGGGAATSWLTGTYQGRKVRASMVPGRPRYRGQSAPRYNYFDIGILDVPGGHNWSISYEASLLGFGKTGWRIKADDKSLKERLHVSDVIALISLPGNPTITYKQREGTLLYTEDVTPQWVPTPERFKGDLELLVRLAEVNEEVNPI